jgi:hypothetical protein
MFNLQEVFSISNETVCKSLHDSYIVEQIKLLYDNDFIKNSIFTAKIDIDSILLTTIEIWESEKYSEWLTEKVDIFDRYSDIRGYVVNNIGFPFTVDTFSDSLKLSEYNSTGTLKLTRKSIEMSISYNNRQATCLSSKLDFYRMKIATVQNDKKEKYDKMLKGCDKFVENALRTYNKG